MVIEQDLEDPPSCCSGVVTGPSFPFCMWAALTSSLFFFSIRIIYFTPLPLLQVTDAAPCPAEEDARRPVVTAWSTAGFPLGYANLGLLKMSCSLSRGAGLRGKLQPVLLTTVLVSGKVSYKNCCSWASLGQATPTGVPSTVPRESLHPEADFTGHSGAGHVEMQVAGWRA